MRELKGRKSVEFDYKRREGEVLLNGGKKRGGNFW